MGAEIIPNNSTGAGDASAANQTNGQQKTQIVDSGGDAVTVTGGKLDVNASVDTTGLATSTIQTDGTQKTQLVDAGGDAVTVTGGKLDVNASIDTTGLATAAKQDTGNTSLASIDTKLTSPLTVQATNLDIRDLSSGTDSVTVTGTVNANTGLSQPLTDTQLRATPVPISGTITATPTGTQNVDVTANTIGLATSAKQDTGNTSLANLDVLLSTRTKPADQQHTIVDSGTLTAVTAITNALPSGNNNIGDVDIASIAAGDNNIGNVDIVTLPSIPAGNNNIGDVDVASIAAGDNNIGNVDIVTMPNVVIDSGTVTAVTSITNPVTVAQATAANLNMTEANSAAIKTAVELIDNVVETNRAAVNPISGQIGVAAADGNVDALTQRVVIAANVLSTNNSSTSTLTSNQIFTGTGEDIMSYNEVRITVYSDVASATDGLSIQQSTDNTNWVIIDSYTIAAATGKTFSVPRQGRYFRIVYTNGGVAQSTFILQTSFTRIAGKSSSQRPSDNYTNQTDLEQQQSFGMNYNPYTDTWYRVRGDSTSGLWVNPQGFNVDYDRRLQESMLLAQYAEAMYVHSGSYGYELR